MAISSAIIATAASVSAGAAGSAAIGAITIAGITISASTVGAIIGGIAALAVTFVGSAIFGTSAQPQNSTSNATNRGTQVRSPVSPHQIVVGTVKCSGTLIYIYSPPQARVGFASCVFGYAPHDFQPNQLLYMATVLSSLPPGAIDLD